MFNILVVKEKLVILKNKIFFKQRELFQISGGSL